MHILSSLQAVAHGADAVQYFQWRKSRGSVEKFHGAVVDHVGHIDTRVGREVSELGRILEAMSPVMGSKVDADVAIILIGKVVGLWTTPKAHVIVAWNMRNRCRALPSILGTGHCGRYH